MPITWESSFETGHRDIDAQHRTLLAIVDELESAEAQPHDSHEFILDVLGHVMDFTISHFSMEEDLMQNVGYPAESSAEMVAQHREFTAYARLRVLEFRAGEMDSILPLQSFLSSWLITHEVGLDKMLAEFIRQRM